MESKEQTLTGHRPPVNVEELIKVKKEPGKEPSRRGKLTYIQDGGRSGRGGLGLKGGGGIGGERGRNFTLIALAVLISLALSLFIFCSKRDANILLGNQKVLEKSIGTMTTSLDTERGRIDNIINNLKTYATKDDLKGFVNQDQLEDALSRFGNITGYVTEAQFNSAISAISNNLSGYATKDQLSPYCYLSKSSTGSYTLNIENYNGGAYLARIHLLYLSPIPYTGTSNYNSAFQSFSGEVTPSGWKGSKFIPEVAWDGSSWSIVGAYSYVKVDSSTFLLGSFSTVNTCIISAGISPIL